MSLQDLLPAILRTADPGEQAQHDATTPTALDYLANDRDGIDLMEYKILAVGALGAGGPATTIRLAVFYPGANTDPQSTGAGTAAANANTFQGFASQSFAPYPNNVLSYDKQRLVAGDRERTPRGSFVIKRISTAANYVAGLAVANTTIPAVNSTTVYVDAQITETLLMSPFIFGSPENKQGFYGIANMNFQRIWRQMPTERGGA